MVTGCRLSVVLWARRDERLWRRVNDEQEAERPWEVGAERNLEMGMDTALMKAAAGLLLSRPFSNPAANDRIKSAAT